MCENESDQDQDVRCSRILEGAGLRCIDADSRDSGDQQKSDMDLLKYLNSTWDGDTILHTAAMNGHLRVIPMLMRYGSDPSVRNDHGHTPYVMSKNKEVRDSFRRFMACYPTAWDYNSAHVPSPLTEDMERERSRKEAERRKEKKRNRAHRQRERVKKEKEEGVESAALSRQQQVSESLSKREKQAMAAELRMAAQLPTSSLVLS